MTTGKEAAAAGRADARWAWWMLAVVIAVEALRIGGALGIGLDPDEAYYTMWSTALAPGYYDHPPAVALMIAGSRALLGNSVLAVRLGALIAPLLVSAALYRTGRLLFPGSAAAALAVIWYNLMAATLAPVAFPDVPSTLFWVLASWAVAEALTSRRANWWLLVGLFAGCGLASKYTNAFLGPGILLFLLLTRDGRRQLRLWQPWAGLTIALAVFAPVLWWNATHDWVSFAFQGARIVTDQGRGWDANLSEFVAAQMAVVGPAVLVFAAAGAVAWLRRPSDPTRMGAALLLLTVVPALAYFFWHTGHARVEVNWTSPLLPALALLGAWAAIEFTPRSWWARGLRWLGLLLQPLLGALLIGFVFIQGVAHPFDFGRLDRTAPLRDWDRLSAQVRAAADKVGAERILVDGGYRPTGELFTYGLFAGDRRPVRDLVARPRYDFLPRAPATGPALLVAEIPPGAWLPPAEAGARLIGMMSRLTGTAAQANYALYLLR